MSREGWEFIFGEWLYLLILAVVCVVNRWYMLQMERIVLKASPLHHGLTHFISAFCRLPPAD